MNGYYAQPVTTSNAIATLAAIGVAAIAVVLTRGYMLVKDQYIARNTKNN